MLLKFYDCKVCGEHCIGLPVDGKLYDKEVCSLECLVSLSAHPVEEQNDISV